MNKRSIGKKTKTRLREKQRNARIIRYALILILLLSIVFGLSYVTRTDWAKVGKINVTGNSLVPAEELKKIVEEGGASAFLGVFKTDNLVLYPKQKVEQTISDRFKTIQKVNISFQSANILDIKVVERVPSYVWCESRESTPEGCYFMDANGYIFAKSANFSGNAYFTYYGLLSGQSSENIIGKIFLSSDRLKALKNFSESVKTLGANPVGLLAHTEDDYELFLSPSGRILFNAKADFLKTFENLQAIVKEQERTQGTSQGNFLNRLDYIDLRFGFKAFFKLK